MDYGVLGTVTVVRDDETSVALPSASLRRLVAFLVSRANTVTSIGNAALHLGLSDGAVRTGMARLRRRLGSGSALCTESSGYVLRSQRIDVVAFEAALDVAAAAGATSTAARTALEQALAWWRGDAYAEFAHEEWASAEAARLDELRAGATESLVDALIAHGEHEAALDRLSPLIDRHPFRDRPRAQRMRSLTAMGRATEALRAFQDYRTQLHDEIGIGPSASLVELDALIAAGASPAGVVPSATGPSPTVDAGHGLPLPRNTAFGLAGIVDRVAAALGDGQLVTLTGIGGIGKTRVALTVAGRVAAEYDRIVLVDLRRASSPGDVPAVVARALGVETVEAAPLALALQRRRTLLVVDNCEHVIESAAGLIDQLLARVRSGSVLATSRAPLELAGERVVSVPVMSLDAATALFTDRSARWSETGREADPATGDLVAEICTRLDRIPLAVELAAACVAHMTLPEIADQLAHRLTFLPGDAARSPQQRTLRGTLDWSYELLDTDQQSLLRALSTFAADFDASAAAAVWRRPLAPTLAVLGALVRASLVVAAPAGGITRYALLEMVRLHAREHADVLGESDALGEAHADHYANELVALDPITLLRAVHEPRPDGAHHDRMLERIAAGADLERLGQLAWRTAMAHRGACWTDPTHRYLGRTDIAAALDGPERAHYAAASMENANVLGRYADQLELADAGLETATGAVRIELLRGAAGAAGVVAPDRVDALIDEALVLVDPRDVDARLELRRTRIDALLLAGDLESAAASLEAVWADGRAAKRRVVRPLAGIDLLWIAVLGHDEHRVRTLGASLSGIPGGEVAGRCASAVSAAWLGRTAASAQHLVAATDLARREGVPLVENDILTVAALRALELGEPERACRLLAASGDTRSPGSLQLQRHVRGLVRDRLGRETIARVRAKVLDEGPGSVVAAELARLRDEAMTDGDPA